MAEAIGGYFVSGGGAGTQVLAADFTPGLVIAVVGGTVEDSWISGETPYISCGLASWQDIDKTGIRQGCQMQRFTTVGQSSGLYRGKFLYHRDASNLAVLDGEITTLDDSGATITWTTRASGYVVYYILVPDQLCYAYTGFSPAPLGGLGLGDYANGAINLGHGYASDADTQMYSQYAGIDSAFYSRVSDGNHARVGDAYGSAALPEFERDYSGTPPQPLWGTRWHPATGQSLLSSATSIVPDALGAVIGQGAESKYITWLTAEIDSHTAFARTLQTTVGQYNDVAVTDHELSWAFVTTCITDDHLGSAAKTGWGYGLWVANGDFHASCAASRDGAGAARTISSRNYSFIASQDAGSATDYLAGRISDAGGLLRFTTDYVSGSSPANDTRLVGIVGSAEELRHLLPIMGVGE